jgi:hypothetical protein
VPHQASDTVVVTRRQLYLFEWAVDAFNGRNIAPLDFRDRSVVLIRLPAQTAGSMGALVKSCSTPRLAIGVGDGGGSGGGDGGGGGGGGDGGSNSLSISVMHATSSSPWRRDGNLSRTSGSGGSDGSLLAMPRWAVPGLQQSCERLDYLRTLALRFYSTAAASDDVLLVLLGGEIARRRRQYIDAAAEMRSHLAAHHALGCALKDLTRRSEAVLAGWRGDGDGDGGGGGGDGSDAASLHRAALTQYGMQSLPSHLAAVMATLYSPFNL